MASPKLPRRFPPNGRYAIQKNRFLAFVGIVGIAFVFFLINKGGSKTSRTEVLSESSHRVSSSSSSSSSNIITGSSDAIIRLRSGLEMPAVGYGTCCRPTAHGKLIYQSTLVYLRYGGKLIDTAMAYNNHHQIGRAIQASGKDRSEIWITSKIAPGKVNSYSDCLGAVDKILEELDTTYADMMLIHTPKLGKEPTIALWKCLIESKRLGKVKAIGVSNFNQGEIEDIAAATGGELPEANEIQLHPWSSKAWKGLAKWHNDKGIVTIAYTSLGGSRFHHADETGESSLWPDVVRSVAKKYSATEAQVLLKWALFNGIAVIPGSGNEEHIKENLSLPDFDLSVEEASNIEKANVPATWWDQSRGPIKYDDEEAMQPWVKRKNGR